MKKGLFLALGMMVAVNAIAAESCTYFAKEVGRHNKASLRALRAVESKMAKKGFTQVFYEKDAAFVLEFFADWTDAGQEMEHVNGDSWAGAKLVSVAHHTVIAHGSRSGAAGHFLGFGKNSKAAKLLSKAMVVIPDCSEL